VKELGEGVAQLALRREALSPIRWQFWAKQRHLTLWYSTGSRIQDKADLVLATGYEVGQ